MKWPSISAIFGPFKMGTALYSRFVVIFLQNSPFPMKMFVFFIKLAQIFLMCWTWYTNFSFLVKINSRPVRDLHLLFIFNHILISSKCNHFTVLISLIGLNLWMNLDIMGIVNNKTIIFISVYVSVCFESGNFSTSYI